MNAKLSTITAKRVLSIAVIATAVAGIGYQTHAQQSASNGNTYHPDATVDEIMESIIMPAANVLWNSVAVEVTADGVTETGPESDEDWETLRWTAVDLAESTNLLVIPGRAMEPAGIEHPDYELSTVQMNALLQSNWSDWVTHSSELHDVALRMISIIDERSTDGLSEIGGELDGACESCHQQFWYPSN